MLLLSPFKLNSCLFSPSEHHSKDVRLPVQLQRAMAAEAEATREARAKVSCLLIDFHQPIQFSAETFSVCSCWAACPCESELKINNRSSTSVAHSRWSPPKESSVLAEHWRKQRLSSQVSYLCYCLSNRSQRTTFTLLGLANFKREMRKQTGAWRTGESEGPQTVWAKHSHISKLIYIEGLFGLDLVWREMPKLLHQSNFAGFLCCSRPEHPSGGTASHLHRSPHLDAEGFRWKTFHSFCLRTIVRAIDLWWPFFTAISGGLRTLNKNSPPLSNVWTLAKRVWTSLFEVQPFFAKTCTFRAIVQELETAKFKNWDLDKLDVLQEG